MYNYKIIFSDGTVLDNQKLSANEIKNIQKNWKHKDKTVVELKPIYN